MKWTPLIFFVFLIAAAFVYPLYPASPLELWYGAVAQIASLVVAAYNAMLAGSGYGRTDGPRNAWFSLSFGLWIWVIAQFMESYCEMILKMISYGTMADAFWFLGYFPMTYGIWLLVRSYRNAGLPLGKRWTYLAQLGLIVIIYALVFHAYVQGQIMEPKREIEKKILDVCYPAMDFILIALASLLIRFGWMLRGGRVARSWVLLCLGFIVIGVSDLWLSYATDFESSFYRLNDVTYLSAYFLIALAGYYQVRVLKSA